MEMTRTERRGPFWSALECLGEAGDQGPRRTCGWTTAVTEPASQPPGVPAAFRRRRRHGKDTSIDHAVELDQHLGPFLIAQDRDQRVDRSRWPDGLDGARQGPHPIRIVGDVEEPLPSPVQSSADPRLRESTLTGLGSGPVWFREGHEHTMGDSGVSALIARPS